MKKIALSFLFIALAFSAFSQDAKSILDKLASDSKACKTMQGNFEYKLENKEANLLENSKGTFLIKGDKYFVDILGAETYFDGKNLYSYLKDAEEVSIQTPEDNDEDFLKPTNLFTIYQKGYNYKYVGKIIENGKSVYVIDLLPKKEDMNFKKLVVKINEKTGELSSIQSIGKTGDNVTIVVTSIKIDTPVKDSKFTFDTNAHPDVEVIDMR